MDDLRGRRVLVVGASSGIGAAIAGAALDQGAHVAALARRRDRLDRLVAGHDQSLAIEADVSDPAVVGAAVTAAAEALGGFDAAVYASGAGALNPLQATDAAVWRRLYDVNVVGANLVGAAAVLRLDADGVMAFVSSRAPDDAGWGFGPYTASKAALDTSIRTWRVEHPGLRFLRIVMGNTFPTEFADGMDQAALVEAMGHWAEQGIEGGMMPVADVGSVVASTLALALAHPKVDVREIRLDARPPRPSR